MDNKRGVESGGMKGEVVDLRTGAAESFEGGGATKEREAAPGERMEAPKDAISQGIPGQPMAPTSDDGAMPLNNDGVQSDLVNLTTRDGEKIEKVWVEKVRDVMKKTKDDPRKREDDVFEVKKDFIRKRFGREIGGGK